MVLLNDSQPRYNSDKVDINSIDIAEELAVPGALSDGEGLDNLVFRPAVVSKFCN